MAEETSSYLFKELKIDIEECLDESGRVKMNLISADTFLRGDKREKDDAHSIRTLETCQSRVVELALQECSVMDFNIRPPLAMPMLETGGREA